jgi:hypothetical protein
MPTSLVSTGVQFPDSTIQTTAAGASAIAVVQTVTANNTSGTLSLPSCFTSTYTRYIVQCSRLVMPSNFVGVTLNFTNNNGSTFQGMVGGYTGQITGGNNAGVGALGMNFSLIVSNPRDTTAPVVVGLTQLYYPEGNQPGESYSNGATFRTSTNGTTGFRLVLSGGNWVSGQIKVWGLT